MSVMHLDRRLTQDEIAALDAEVSACDEKDIIEAGWIPLKGGYLGPILTMRGEAHQLFWVDPSLRDSFVSSSQADPSVRDRPALSSVVQLELGVGV